MKLPINTEGLEQRRDWLWRHGWEHRTWSQPADPRFHEDGDRTYFARIGTFGARVLVTRESQRRDPTIVSRVLCRVLDLCAEHNGIDWEESPS